MQTYKKRFRKKRTTKKRQSQKNRILKGVVCYKIRVIPRSNGGGLFDGSKFERLENMIKKDELYTSNNGFLKEIIDGKDSKNIEKKNKVFNEIFNETVYLPQDELRDTEAIKSKKRTAREEAMKVKYLLHYLNTGRSSDELRDKFDKEKLEKQLLDETKKFEKEKKDIEYNITYTEGRLIDESEKTTIITPLTNKLSSLETDYKKKEAELKKNIDDINAKIKDYTTNKKYTDGSDLFISEYKDTLNTILQRKIKANELLNTISEALNNEAIKKQLTPAQIESIKSKIERTGGITTALSSVTSKMSSTFSNGAVSLGNWLTPEVLDDDGIPIKLENKQKIQFLWYPRKHIDYKKGKSGTKHDPTDIEYGDFMVLIEPEQYANTGEFFKQTYHSVEDLLATLLMGCTDPYCLKGQVKREPYNWREFEITNEQPTVDKENKQMQ
jgi:hypothetical protein